MSMPIHLKAPASDILPSISSKIKSPFKEKPDNTITNGSIYLEKFHLEIEVVNCMVSIKQTKTLHHQNLASKGPPYMPLHLAFLHLYDYLSHAIECPKNNDE